MMLRLIPAMLLAIAAWPAAAPAQEPMAPACAATVAATGLYAPWNAPRTIAAGRDRAGAALVQFGTAYAVALAPTPDVAYAQRPEKPGGSVSHGGLLAFDVMRAGTVRIALGSAAWIDVIGPQGAVVSAAHGHGPDCTGIRKMGFVLTPGHYVVQIAANGTAQTTVLPLLLP